MKSPKLLLVFLLVAANASQADDRVSIATLNCEFLSTRFVHLKYGLPFSRMDWTAEQEQTWTDAFTAARYEEAAKATAAAIRRIDADVILLTEVARVPSSRGEFVTPNDLTVLHGHLSDLYPHLAFGESADTVTWQNVAMLSKREFVGIKSTIPGREGFFAELDDVESEDDTGVTKGMAVALNVNGELVFVYGVHLKSERGGHESDEQRIAQASIVRRNYLRRLEEGRHVIVVGDLNDGRGQPTLRRMRGFDDIEEDLLQTGGPRFFKRRSGETTAAFNARMREHWTYEFQGQRNQIDHLLISQSVRKHCTKRNNQRMMDIDFIEITETLPETSSPITDHRAVKLTLQFLDEHL